MVLLVVLLTYFSVSLGFQLNKLWAMQHSIMEMNDRVVQLRDQNEYLWERLTILESEGYVEETARERLGLIRPGEVRVVPVLPEDSGGRIPDPSIKD